LNVLRKFRSKTAVHAVSFYLSCLLVVGAESGKAVTVQIPPSKDNTLFESTTGGLSNGIGWYFFAGRTSQLTNSIRRGIIAFNLADSVPPGSTIQAVTLTINCSKAATAFSRTITLRKVISDWGEGSTDAVCNFNNEGCGGGSTINSVTWIHRFYNSDFWGAPGGDFSGTTSGSVNVTTIGSYTFASTSQMVADLQGWVDNPANNFGWVLIGSESVAATAKRFDTKENPTAANRPYLTVTFEPPCCVGIRGDIDGNGTTADVQDLTYMINDIYRGGPGSPCPQEADLDNNGTSSQVQDLTFLINDIFRGGPNPPVCQ
jgi:hypothetical protein